MKKNKIHSKKTSQKRIGTMIFSAALIFFGALSMFSAIWYIVVYGDTGFASIIFSLLAGASAVESGILLSFSFGALLPALCLTALLMFLLFFEFGKKRRLQKYEAQKQLQNLLQDGKEAPTSADENNVSENSAVFTDKKAQKKKQKRQNKKPFYPFKKWFIRLVSVILCLAMFSVGAVITNLPQFIVDLNTPSTFYDAEYADPAEVTITFPAQKRNLIYIFMESMETTFFSKEQGGAMEKNVIPELYNLAAKNTNFSQDSGVGGWGFTNGSSWTIAAMVAQTSGTPLSSTLGNNYSSFLPGVISINNILHKNGYKQALMVGSDGGYSGRAQYFKQHGVDDIYDYNTAKKDKIIGNKYHVWWGMEDQKTYTYAKKKITELAAGSEPFAFTMLTVDTHHIGGYVCSQCKNKYKEPYQNVYACASKQLNGFVNWLKKQDFYKNTTIVICGDHLSMDNNFFARTVKDKNYERHVYNCFINSTESDEYSKGRIFTSYDMFPTTLAAMGCKIEGERLGFGTNLFSGDLTLSEKYGFAEFNNEMSKKDSFYNTFLKKREY